MRRFLLIAVVWLLAVLVLAGGLAVYLLHDEPFLKRQIGELVADQTGRSLNIDGPLEISFGRVTTLEARGIRFANPDWAQSPELFRAGRLRIGIDLPSLFSNQPRLTEIVLEDCAVALERAADGRDSWALDIAPEETGDLPDDGPGSLPFVVEHTAITNCRLGLRAPDGAETLDLRLDSAVLGQENGERIGTTVRGELNGQPLTIDGWLAPAGVLAHGGPLRHELQLHAGPVQLDSAGTIDDVRQLSGLELNARFSGPDIGTLLRNFQQPPFSEGPFDFRIDLNTRGDLTAIDIDGDLGDLEIFASGEIDRLVDASRGRLELRVAGPDLQALGDALGVTGLVSEPYTASLEATIEDGALRFGPATLRTGGDLVEIGGMIALQTGLAGSEVELQADSDELARWAELLHQGPGPAGAVRLESSFDVDSNGRLSIDALLRQGEGRLRLRGPVGSLEQGLDATLQVEFSAPRPGPLLHWLAGRELPAIPLEAHGTLGISPGLLRFDGARVATGPHELRIDGQLGLGDKRASSEFEVSLDSPDLALLGRSLGRDDLPAGPLRLDARMQQDGPGFTFSVNDGSLGDVRLRLDGRVADSAEPLRIDADFELLLPGPGAVHLWLPELALPEQPIAVSGSLRNRPQGLAIEQARIALGDIEVRADGMFKHEGQFDVKLTASGPDASALSGPVRVDLPGQPFRLGARLAGDAALLEVRDIEATLGDSRLEGEVTWAQGAERRLQARLHAPMLDLLPWAVEDEAPKPEPAKRVFVFDDTPVLELADLGIQIGGQLTIDQIRLNTARASQIEIGVALTGRRLEITPFSFRGMTGGLVSGSLILDGDSGVPILEADLHGADVTLAFGAYEGQDPTTLPRGKLDLELRGQGQTHRELASSLTGRLRMRFGTGELAPSNFDFLLSDFLTELIDTLNPFTEPQNVTRLDCLVAAADATDGQVVVSPVVIHAERLTVVSQGTIDLDTEKMNIDFETRPRKGLGITASDLFKPFIRVGGTLANPAIALDPASTVVEGGLAVATAGLSILAKSLANRYLRSKNPCEQALSELEERDSAKP
jgi:uncharacterized protein involved in outer membrane biogenesis